MWFFWLVERSRVRYIQFRASNRHGEPVFVESMRALILWAVINSVPELEAAIR